MTEDPRPAPGLFDLPLEAPPPAPPPLLAEVEGEPEPERRRAPRSTSSRPQTLSLFEDDAPEPRTRAPRGTSAAPHTSGVGLDLSHRRDRLVALPRPAPDPPAAPMLPRLRGSSGDLMIVAAAGAVAAVGARLMGVSIGIAQLLPLALFLLSFSFVYFVVPLAFWGSTPGMTWAGLVARANSRGPISFGQAALRWLGSWLTWVTLGLPGLLALSGRSLADRISGSTTYPLETPSGS